MGKMFRCMGLIGRVQWVAPGRRGGGECRPEAGFCLQAGPGCDCLSTETTTSKLLPLISCVTVAGHSALHL